MMETNFFASYLDHIENLVNNFREAIEELPPQALDWLPGPEMNSVAVLIAHTAGSLRFWIGDIAMTEPSGRVREREFQTKGVSSQYLMGLLDSVLDYARSALPRLRLEDLEKERVSEDRRVALGWALLHALEHANLHLGHVQLTSQLWKEREHQTGQ